MSVEQLKHTVSELTSEEIKEFSGWFEDYMAALWDQQMLTDATEGKLDFLIRETDAEYEAGLCKPL